MACIVCSFQLDLSVEHLFSEELRHQFGDLLIVLFFKCLGFDLLVEQGCGWVAPEDDLGIVYKLCPWTCYPFEHEYSIRLLIYYSLTQRQLFALRNLLLVPQQLVVDLQIGYDHYCCQQR